MRHEDQEASPVRFDIHVARLPKSGLPVAIEASEEQREELARVHDLVSVGRFRADLLATAWKRNGVKVEGKVEADIVQACVVTLEPIESHIEEDVSAVFLPEDSKLGREGFGTGGEIMIDVDGPDAPETFAGTTIDVGSLAEEFFALAIEPYPRKPGMQVKPTRAETQDDEDPDGFRAKLRSLLPKT